MEGSFKVFTFQIDSLNNQTKIMIYDSIEIIMIFIFGLIMSLSFLLLKPVINIILGRR